MFVAIFQRFWEFTAHPGQGYTIPSPKLNLASPYKPRHICRCCRFSYRNRLLKLAISRCVDHWFIKTDRTYLSHISELKMVPVRRYRCRNLTVF